MGAEFNFDKQFAKTIRFDQIVNGRKAFGFDPRDLNNMEPIEAIRHIDRTLENFYYQTTANSPPPPRSLKDMVRFVSKIQKEHFKNVGAGLGKEARHDEAREDIVMLFSLLDTFGYWGDPRKKYNRGSRLSDARHALSASYFSGLVSRDHQFLEKSRAAYEYMGIDICAYTTDDFRSHLCEVVQGDC